MSTVIIIAAAADRGLSERVATALRAAGVEASRAPTHLPEWDPPRIASWISGPTLGIFLLTAASAADARFLDMLARARAAGVNARVAVTTDPSAIDTGAWPLDDVSGWLGGPEAPAAEHFVEAIRAHVRRIAETLRAPPKPLYDVYVSASRNDVARTQVIVEILRAQGLTVWWDADLKSDASFESQMQMALDGSTTVLVLQSEALARSDWVQLEVARGLAQKKVLPVTLDGTTLDTLFAIQGIDLRRWRGDAGAAELAQLTEQVRRFVGRRSELRQASEGVGSAREDLSLPEPKPVPGVGMGRSPDAFKEKLDDARFSRPRAPAPKSTPVPSARSPASVERRAAKPRGGPTPVVRAPLKRSMAGQRRPAIEAQATAFAPKTLRRGNAEIVQVIVHQPRESVGVSQLAKLADARAAPAGMLASIGDLPTGTLVRVVLDVRGGASTDGNVGQEWRGRPLVFPFTVEATEARDVKQVAITARVLANDAQIGLISFVRPLGKVGAKAAPADRVEVKMRRAKRVFLSYSSKDRETVAMVAQAYASAGVPCFFDRTSLTSGEDWSPRLLKEIERADLFHLFWSKNASASEWVAKEARHALKRRRASWTKQPDITVQMLDGPPWAPHPDDLDSINFDDFVRAAIVGYARGDG